MWRPKAKKIPHNSTTHATFFWILFPNMGYGFMARRLQDTCHQWLVFQVYLDDKERRFKTNWILRLILLFNLRLQGYSIWCVIFQRIPKIIFWGLEIYLGKSTTQPEAQASRKVHGRPYSRQSSEELKDDFTSTLKNSCKKKISRTPTRIPCNTTRTISCNTTMTPTL